MILEPRQLRKDNAKIFGAFGNFDPSQLFHAECIGPVISHRAKIIESVGVRHRPEIAHALANLFMITMQISEDWLELAHDLAFERDVHPEYAVRGGMLRPHRDFKKLALESGSHAHRRPLHCFERFDHRAHLYVVATSLWDV